MENSNFEQSREERENPNFAVEKYPARNGFIYELHFATEAEAEEGVKAFWNAREGTGMARQGLKSGMLKPFKHDITSGDRTAPRQANPGDLRKHPDKPFVVQFNGNTEALSPNGEEALRSLGFIE
ncbi:MAG: hypothetical protein KGJ89_04235 [Patescibacteria group bacterium]|nr:hypothetical protein [Patescibacteria group bacterium]MDE2015331.1 hypothetical protein [Patescibacteria group bacterium]MDE2227136.1 hypothetical protein [Patescibacteria group bacterium]